MIPLRIKLTLNAILASLITAAVLAIIVIASVRPEVQTAEQQSAVAAAQTNATLLSLALDDMPANASIADAMKENTQLSFSGLGMTLPVADGQVTDSGRWAWSADLTVDGGRDADTIASCLLHELGTASESYSSRGLTCDGVPVGTALVRGPDDVPRWVMVSWSSVPWSTSPPMSTMLTPMLITISVLLILVISVITWRSGASITRTAASAVRTAERFRGGDMTARMHTGSDDELGAIATSFNAAADELVARLESAENSAGRQRRLLSDAAHELRTPTAALLASATALENPETRDEAAVKVAPQLRRLSALTEDLLELSRLDAGRVPVVAEDVDLSALTAEVADESGPDVSAAGSGVMAHTDPMRVRGIVINLVSNAQRHGRPPVSVTVGRDGDAAFVTVSDCGDGVPVEHREDVFWRFTQLDTSRSTKGAGLGLAIARDNARLLGGELTIDEDGRTFRLTLPGADPHGQ